MPKPVNTDMQSAHSYARGEFQCPEPDDTVAAPKPGGVGYRFVKRAFDICFSAGVCAVLAIPVAAVCAAICIDSPGKPFFRQERIGLGGKRIYIWKLRSMVPDAHSNPERYMTPEQLETWRREQKLDDDPRITRVGRFLRRTSLDELPQFINVLAGDLSVIGPRPVTLEETYEFGNGRDEFLSCKPGITGWWQVTERNVATWGTAIVRCSSSSTCATRAWRWTCGSSYGRSRPCSWRGRGSDGKASGFCDSPDIQKGR